MPRKQKAPQPDPMVVKGSNAMVSTREPVEVPAYKLPPTPKTPSATISAGGGNGQVILILGGVLLTIAEWNTIVHPLLDAAWSGKTPAIRSSDWQRALGAIVFLFILVFIASTSDEASGLIVLMVVGMFLVFLVFNGQFLSGIFNWLGGGNVPPPSLSSIHQTPTTPPPGQAGGQA